MTPSPERNAALARVASIAIETVAGTQWPMRLAEALRDLDATWQESAEVCADVAWQARAAGNSALVLLDPEHVTDPGPGPVICRAYRHLYLSALRYDFRCRSIESLLNQVPLSVLNADPYSWALYAFARLGQSRSDGLAVMEQVLATASDHPKTAGPAARSVAGRSASRPRGRAARPRGPAARGRWRRSRSRSSARLRRCARWASTARRARPSSAPWNSCRRATWPSTPTWCASTP